MYELIPRPRRTLAPGAVHVPGWLDLDRQRELVLACREWASEGPGIRAATLPGGATMSVRTVCLGWHWIPYRYSRTRDDQDGSPVAPFPQWLADLGRQAVSAAYDTGADTGAQDYAPDVALINFYEGDARMGQHRDVEERCDAPVVSLSLGQGCVFRFGNPERRGKPYTDVDLLSGDLVVFGGASRFAYHGVPRLGTDPDMPDIGLRSGRLNLTIRMSGLTDGPPE
ncbi:MAG: alpha-ketoglutarate-dependent dioxygenase AlkB [Pseudonocardia sp.]|nr:alpha-ketoglutarate-dependent dioxygenase AlkB [Pseudonocardia sp.]